MAMTLQEIFDKVAAHLLTQKKKSLTTKSSAEAPNICAYRGDDGEMCAVGCLITDEAYSFELERNVVRNEVVQKALEKSGVINNAPNGGIDGQRTILLAKLQNLHDSRKPEDWKFGLSQLACQEGLEYTILDKF